MLKKGDKLISLKSYHSYNDYDLEYEQICTFDRYYTSINTDNIKLIYIKGYNDVFYEKDFISLKKLRKDKINQICSSQERK